MSVYTLSMSLKPAGRTALEALVNAPQSYSDLCPVRRALRDLGLATVRYDAQARVRIYSIPPAGREALAA